MINLVPLHTSDLNYLYELVKERSNWFIKLRYIAVVMLFSFYIFLAFFSSENFYPKQSWGILLILGVILFLNFIFSAVSRSGLIRNEIEAFNPIKFALLQILSDLTALLILVYLTGLINSPFYLFFIFHAIIGSLILPGALVYFIFIVVLLLFTTLNILTHFGIIPEFLISTSASLMQLKPDYLILKLGAFWLTILLSVMFVNYLTSALYRREQQLMEAIHKIELSEIEKQKYIMAVVHEVKSPLAAIVSYLNLLLSGVFEELTDNVKAVLVKMKKRSDDAIELTNDILQVARIRQMKELEKEEVSVAQIIENIFDRFSDRAGDEEITLSLSDKTDGKKQLSANKHLLELMLSNIISNSIKYNHKGGKVEAEITDDGSFMKIKIADTGIGIPADEIHNITDEFYRAVNAKKSRSEGTGLGMYVANQIVEKHNGELTIVSPSEIGDEAYPGTVITIVLPLN